VAPFVSLPRWTNALAVLGFALPVVAYFWLIHRYGLNTIYADQWANVTVISHAYSGTLSFGTLWVQHNENRLLFPNLVVLALAYTTHYNIVDELYLSGVMQVVAVGLLIGAHRCRSSATPWLLYCPVAFMLLSFVQNQNALSGFQLAWVMILLSLAGCLFLLDRPHLSWPLFAAAVAVAMVGTFSSLQGMLIWPSGLVLLYHRRRSARFFWLWIAAAAACAVAYFHGYHSQQAVAGGYGYLFSHPLDATKFFFYAVGDVVGAVVQPKAGNGAVILLGIVIVALAVAVLVLFGLRRDERGGTPIGVALIVFGLLFAATITEGRIGYGLGAAGASRYATFDLLIPVGCYLAVLDRSPWLAARRHRPADGAIGVSDVPQVTDVSVGAGRAWRGTVLTLVRTILFVVIGLQVVLGLTNGLSASRAAKQFDTGPADVLVNIDNASDSQVLYCLSPFGSPPQIREQAAFLKKYGLGLFATPDAATYAHEGLIPGLTCR
jgi:Flp pilus assembly pilin Flp